MKNQNQTLIERLFSHPQAKQSIHTAFMLLVIAIVGMHTDFALAQAMPWDNALCTVANDLKGPTASAIAVIVLVIGGIMIAAGEHGGVFKWSGGIMLGFSLMFGGYRVLSWFGVGFGC